MDQDLKHRKTNTDDFFFIFKTKIFLSSKAGIHSVVGGGTGASRTVVLSIVTKLIEKKNIYINTIYM